MVDSEDATESHLVTVLLLLAFALQVTAVWLHAGALWALVALVGGATLAPLAVQSSARVSAKNALFWVGVLAQLSVLAALMMVERSLTLFTSQAFIAALALSPRRYDFAAARAILSGYALFILVFFGASGAIPGGFFSSSGIHAALEGARPLEPDDLRLVWLSNTISIGIVLALVIAQIRALERFGLVVLALLLAPLVLTLGELPEALAAGAMLAGVLTVGLRPVPALAPTGAFHVSAAAFLIYGLAAVAASLAVYEYHVPARVLDPALQSHTFRSPLVCERGLQMEDLFYTEDDIHYDFADLANETDATLEAFTARGELASPDALAAMLGRYPEYQSLWIECTRRAARRNLRWGMIESFRWNVYPVGSQRIAADLSRERIRAFPLTDSER